MPAVAVIRKRLVLFILIRFKGYLDGQYIIYDSTWLEFYIRRQYLRWRDEIQWYQRDSVKAQAAFYVITDVEGRRHRSQKGIVSPVVFAVNDECHRLDLRFRVFIPQ